MKRSQAVYRTLPPRQTSHVLFVGEIVDKYSGMQRNAGKLPLTHRLAVSSDRKRKPALKPVPLQVQIVLPNPAPSPVRVIERERPVYRDRPVTGVTPTSSETAKPNRISALEPPKERVIEREKVIERERVIERQEIVERERVVEKKVVIVREVERIIREQRILREQAIMLPIRESDGARSISDVQPRRRLQDGQLVHTDHPTQPDRLNHRGKRRAGTEPLPSSVSQSDQSILVDDTDQPGQTDQVVPKGQATDSDPSVTPDRHNMTSSGSHSSAQGDAPAFQAMQRQSWPLHIAKKSGWRTPPERAQPEKSKTQSRTKRARRDKKKIQNEPQSQPMRAVNAKLSVPRITLINRKIRRSDSRSERPNWRLSSALPAPLRESRPIVNPRQPGTAPKQADIGIPTVNRMNGHGESESRDRPIVAGRAVIADPSRIRNDKPAQYRFVQAWEHSDSPVQPNWHNPSASSFARLAHLSRNGNRQKEGTSAKPAFLQGEALHRHTIPLTWATQPAPIIKAQSSGRTTAQTPFSHDAQAGREKPATARNGKQEREETTDFSSTGRWTTAADSGQRWSSLRPVHIRRRVSSEWSQPYIEVQAHGGNKAWVDKPESPDTEMQTAVPSETTTASVQEEKPSVPVQEKNSSGSLQNAEPIEFEQKARPVPIVQDEKAVEIVQARLMRSGQHERAPTVHVRRESSRTMDDDVQPVKGTIKRTKQEPIAGHEQNPNSGSALPIAKFAKPRLDQSADGSSAQGADNRARSLMQEHGMQNGTFQRKQLISLNQPTRTQSNRYSPAADRPANSILPPPSGMDSSGTTAPGRKVRVAIAQSTNVPSLIARRINASSSIVRGTIAPGSKERGAVVPGSIVQRVHAQRSNAEASRAPGADSQVQPPSAPSAHELNEPGTNAQVQNQTTIGWNTQQLIPLVNVAQDDNVQQRDVLSRGTAVWRVSRADRQLRADQPEQGARTRTTSASAMVQRRQSSPPKHSQAAASGLPSLSRHSQAAVSGQLTLPRHGQAHRQPASHQSAATIAMQPIAPLFGAALATAELHQSASIFDGLTPGLTLTARSNAASAASAHAQHALRVQSTHRRGPAAAPGQQHQAAQTRPQMSAALQPTGPLANTAFAAIPLAYASAQAVAAAASASHAPPVAVIPESAAAPPMELRRQPAPPPAESPPEASASPGAVKSAIDPEQLQQAISKLPMLNPDQIADQVYKSLAKRMKFEQRLQGY